MDNRSFSVHGRHSGAVGGSRLRRRRLSAHHLVVALLAAVTMLWQVTGIGVAGGSIVGNYNVALYVIRSGNVDVVDALGQLNCEQVSTCILSAPVGSSITVTATAAPGWTFTGWSGLGCSTSSECTFDLIGNFEGNTAARLTAVAQPEGAGTGVSLTELALPDELQGGRLRVHDISADGRFLLYEFTAADYSISGQVRWHDRFTGEDIVVGSDLYGLPAMSADGRYVASTSDANSVLLWDANSREQTVLAAEGTRPTMDVTARFIAYWWNSTAYSLDRESGQVISRPTSWLPVMAPDASTMVVPQQDRVELVDPVTGALQASFPVTYTFMPIRISSSGAFAYGYTNNAPADRIGVSRLDLATGELILVPRSADSYGCSGYRSNLTAPDDGMNPYFTTWSGIDGAPYGPLVDGQFDYYGIYRASFDAGVGGATSASGITLPIPQPSNECASVVATPDGSTVIFATERLLPASTASASAISVGPLAPAVAEVAPVKVVLARRESESAAIMPLPARRLVDTRPGQLGELEKPSGRIGSDVSTRLAPGVPVRWIVAGTAGIPAEAAAVAVNVTAVGPSANGNLRVYQCESESSAPPVVSMVNFRAGVTQANSAITAIATDGGICVLSTAAADVVVDVSGYVPSGEQFTALESPTRLVDTRAGRVGALEKPGEPVGSDVAVRLAAGVPVRWRMTDSAGIPAEVAALAVNVTVINPSASGNLRVYPCESPSSTPPVVSLVNFTAAVTIANSSIAATAADGGICFLSTASVDVAVDAAGYFSTTSSLAAVAPPVRLVDTRSGRVGALEKSGAVPGYDISLRLAAGVPFRIVVGGAAGIPTSALLVALNLTAVSPAASGNLRVYGCTSTATGVPRVSNLNFRTGVTMANSAIVGLASNGGVCLYSTSSVHVVVDAAAFVT